MQNTKNNPKSVYETILSRRSIRRFKQKPIKIELLKNLVNAARLAPSAGNLQPLEFIVVNNKDLCSEIFKTIGWAGYLKDWSPNKNEQPSAYIVILSKETKNQWYIRDASLSSENIVLTAENNNIGSCILLNFKKDKIRELLKIPNNLEIDSLIALGYKAENPVLEDTVDCVKYWHDEKQILHVPKRKLDEILHINKF